MGDEEFDAGDAGAAAGTPITCGAIKKNSFVIIKGRPCKIVETSSSKTGKHGAAKVNYVGIDIFTGKKLEECRPSSFTVYSPVIEKTECTVVGIDGEGYLELLLPDNTMRSDINAGEMLELLKEKYDNLKSDEDLMVTFISAMGQDKVTEHRITTNK
ncbi:hypothetical protein Aperf_G00000024582 [Anoplocephala perfoliata]